MLKSQTKNQLSLEITKIFMNLYRLLLTNNPSMPEKTSFNTKNFNLSYNEHN